MQGPRGSQGMRVAGILLSPSPNTWRSSPQHHAGSLARLPTGGQAVWFKPAVLATGRKTQLVLEEKLKRLEEECKQQEAERVSLELELTELRESLRKALAGGVTLGLAIEPRSGTSSPQVAPAGMGTRIPSGLGRHLPPSTCKVLET